MVFSFLASFQNRFFPYFFSGYYRVIERSVGEWQTKCLKKPGKPTQNDIVDICQRLGYMNATDIHYRLLDPETEPELSSKYRDAVKIVTTNLFSNVKLNDKFQLQSIQPSRNTTQIQPWNANDNANCYQLEINCGA